MRWTDHCAYMANPSLALLAATGMKTVIPSTCNRKVSIAHDAGFYRMRNRIECCFDKLKHSQRIATRLERRDVYILSFLSLACTLLQKH